jgi:hypothetical protein
LNVFIPYSGDAGDASDGVAVAGDVPVAEGAKKLYSGDDVYSAV